MQMRQAPPLDPNAGDPGSALGEQTHDLWLTADLGLCITKSAGRGWEGRHAGSETVLPIADTQGLGKPAGEISELNLYLQLPLLETARSPAETTFWKPTCW